MRYSLLTVAALLALCPLFGQQDTPSGILVATPPPKFKADFGKLWRAKLNAAPKQIIAPFAAPKPCAIRLLEVPVKEGIDNGIFLKASDDSGKADSSMVISPPAPPCPR
jgi:hypothetical protein